ncbi:transposase [Streptomyces sp. RerS4]|nr:transposase [Streptomyces sp. RerS4]UQX04581.1 transposase [Streptomyces sp. RerS4]
MFWTTRYITAAAVSQLRAEGHEIRDEDVARLSRSSTRTCASRADTTSPPRSRSTACGRCVPGRCVPVRG